MPAAISFFRIKKSRVHTCHRLPFDRRKSVAAERDSVTLAAERDSVTLATGRDSVTLAAERDSVTLAAERDSVTLAAERDSVTLAAERDSVTLAAERDSVTLAAERDSVTLFLVLLQPMAGSEESIINGYGRGCGSGRKSCPDVMRSVSGVHIRR